MGVGFADLFGLSGGIASGIIHHAPFSGVKRSMGCLSCIKINNDVRGVILQESPAIA